MLSVTTQICFRPSPARSKRRWEKEPGKGKESCFKEKFEGLNTRSGGCAHHDQFFDFARYLCHARTTPPITWSLSARTSRTCTVASLGQNFVSEAPRDTSRTRLTMTETPEASSSNHPAAGMMIAPLFVLACRQSVECKCLVSFHFT